MLIGILGSLGSGKTLLLTIFCFKKLLNNWRVYSNYKINDGNINFIEPIDLLEISKGKNFVALDEVYAWLDSRVSASATNRILSYLMFQSRKKGMDIGYTAQLGSSVDLRLRELTDIIIECVKIPKVGFLYYVNWINLQTVYTRKIFLPLNVAKKYFVKYDTTEVIKPLGFEKLKKQLAKSK